MAPLVTRSGIAVKCRLFIKLLFVRRAVLSFCYPGYIPFSARKPIRPLSIKFYPDYRHITVVRKNTYIWVIGVLRDVLGLHSPKPTPYHIRDNICDLNSRFCLTLLAVHIYRIQACRLCNLVFDICFTNFHHLSSVSSSIRHNIYMRTIIGE